MTVARGHAMTLCDIECCCGHTACACISRSQATIDELERHVHEAGKVGQALLEQYESYVKQSEQQRQHLTTAMRTLESEKLALETANSKTIEENRNLLDQLEELNSAVSDSDQQILFLNQTLDSTRLEVQKLNSLAHKAAQLEQELSVLETERAQLDQEAAAHWEDRRVAEQRWKRAEGTIMQLQDQIESMDRDTREERKRHNDAIALMAKDRSHRPQGLSPSNTFLQEGSSFTAHGGAVSFFVRDILQDNSLLQNGILELRELLLASHKEVRSLRLQLDLEQSNPADIEPLSQVLPADVRTYDNSDWLLESVPELHVHHHYHQQARQPTRKVRRRRQVSLSTSQRRFSSRLPFQPIFEPSTTQDHVLFKNRDMTGTDASTGSSHRPKWSIHSTASESLYASSVLSTTPPHLPSVFDSYDINIDSTRATTPASSAPQSPLLVAGLEEASSAFLPGSEFGQGLRNTKGFSTETPQRVNGAAGAPPCAQVHSEIPSTTDPQAKPLRAVRSHDSFMSVAGMDIHAPNRTFGSSAITRPLLSPLIRSSKLITPRVTASLAVSPAISELSMVESGSSRYMLQRQALSSRPRKDVSSLQRVGGWVFGRHSSMRGSDVIEDQIKSREAKAGTLFRSPGINQPGPIFGIPKPQPTPTEIRPSHVDAQLLRESLQEEHGSKAWMT